MFSGIGNDQPVPSLSDITPPDPALNARHVFAALGPYLVQLREKITYRRTVPSEIRSSPPASRNSSLQPQAQHVLNLQEPLDLPLPSQPTSSYSSNNLQKFIVHSQPHISEEHDSGIENNLPNNTFVIPDVEFPVDSPLGILHSHDSNSIFARLAASRSGSLINHQTLIDDCIKFETVYEHGKNPGGSDRKPN